MISSPNEAGYYEALDQRCIMRATVHPTFGNS
jgi:hypothetical protein